MITLVLKRRMNFDKQKPLLEPGTPIAKIECLEGTSPGIVADLIRRGIIMPVDEYEQLNPPKDDTV